MELDTPKMSHEEMIDTLKWLVFGTFYRTTVKEREALDMAIALLEQKPCDDCVSRQAVLDLCDSKDPDYKVIHFKEDVECLPSVQSEQKWIPVSEKLPENGRQVLCCNKRGSVFTSALTYINKDKYGHKFVYFGKHYEVVAWMPLLKSYEPQESE